MLKLFQRALVYRAPTPVFMMNRRFFSAFQSNNYSTQFELTPEYFIDTLKNIPKDTEVPFVVLDVRDANELQIADLPSTTEKDFKIPKMHIPLNTVLAGEEISKLPEDKYIVCLCRRGRRSLNAALYLKEKGYKVQNLQGGIEKISDVWQIVPRYPPQ